MTYRAHFLGCLLLLAFLVPNFLTGQSFRKGYKAYQRRDFPAAVSIFQRHQSKPKRAAGAGYFIAKIQLANTRDFPGLLALDNDLRHSDSLCRRLSPKRARRWQRKYGLDTAAILDLRLQTQRWMVAWARARGTLGALDSLLQGLSKPLPPLPPEIAAARVDIVNAHLDASDYDDMTLILNRYLDAVLPDNYYQTRRMNEQIWPAFLEKYSPCALDQFGAAHPRTFVGRDCWRRELKPLFCSGTLSELLEFHQNNRWTALEVVLLNTIADRAADSLAVAALSAEQQQHLADLRRRNALRSALRSGMAARDTSTTLRECIAYISRYAPRYSAFRLMEESLQFFLEGRHYGSAIRLLETVRPYFTDSLPPPCATNFDFQLRVKPWIDGKLPILREPDKIVQQRPLTALNTPEGDEFSPVVSADGLEIFFAARNRPGNLAGADVFYARRSDRNAEWPAPVLVPGLSGPGQQIPLSLTADGRQLLLWHQGKLQLCRRPKAGAEWGAPVPLPVGGIEIMGKGFLSADGKTLVLEGAYSAGGATLAPDLDLFVSELDPTTGAWSRPSALGADINTDGQETSPFLSPDGKTLWYSSSGYPGLGSSDVFVARRNSDNWTRWERPQNLGKEWNDTYPHRGFTTISLESKLGWWSTENGDLWEGVLDIGK
ncbi:MAG: PD40 domain-containing protein [Saprospiraceae bacterium]|nr:PD40 domain-containing protein [Saprospiraceae bacterium]